MRAPSIAIQVLTSALPGGSIKNYKNACSSTTECQFEVGQVQMHGVGCTEAEQIVFGTLRDDKLVK